MLVRAEDAVPDGDVHTTEGSVHSHQQNQMRCAGLFPDPHDVKPDITAEPARAGRSRWTLFEDRYGAGSQQRLMTLLEQPCVTFAEIASRFGVTRERVRQWHAQLMPAAPSGHRRQQLCRTHRQRRKLLEDPLFRTFYRNARPSVPSGRIQPVPARDGFRTRSVSVNDRTVAIRTAAQSPSPSGQAMAYQLHRSVGSAEFVYYHLAGSDFLLLPTTDIPPRGSLFVDEPTSEYRRFKNTFDALILFSL